MRPLLELYLGTLPLGYALIARLWPDEPLSWVEFAILGLLVAIWPLTALAILIARLDRS